MTQSHYINKLKFAVTAPTSADGFALKSAMSQRFWQTVVPALSDVFDRFADADEVIKIENLDINLSHIPFNDWETELPSAVCRVIQDALERILHDEPTASQLLKGIKVEKQPIAKSQFVAWLYFLETGQLPPTASIETDWRQAALDLVAANTQDVEILRGLLRRNKIVIERLVLQHDEAFLTTLAEAMSGRKQTDLRLLRETYEAVLTDDVFIQLLKEATHKPTAIVLLSARDIEVVFWQMVFEQLAKGVQTIDVPLFTADLVRPILTQRLKNDYIPFLKTIIVREKPTSEKGNTAKGAPSRLFRDVPSVYPNTSDESNVEESVFLEKEKETAYNQSLQIQPSFIAFLKQKATNEAAANALIALFEKEIKAQEVAIRHLFTPSVSDTSKATILKKERDAIESVTFNKENAETEAGTTERESDNDKQESPVKTIETTQKEVVKEIAEKATLQDEKALTLESVEQKGGSETEEDKGDDPLPTITHAIAPNAGIVLLHPFLKPFFEDLGLVKAGKFENKKAQRRAAALLHYLATGATEMAEYDMAMPKLLVGLPLERTVDRRIVLTDLERTEADNLLNAVIKHWKALGGTSADGLRDGFLKRYGKLTHRSDGWLLQVEAKTLDILLDRLPWGFGIVQLSWMKEMLFVEWH